MNYNPAQTTAMKRFLIIIIPLAILGTGQYGITQTPRLTIYFNDGLTQNHESQCPPDPPGTVFDSLYIVAEGFISPISQIEYSVKYDPAFYWITDCMVYGTAVGNTATGIIQSWSTPQDASSQLLLSKVYVIWICHSCFYEVGCNTKVCVDSNPNTGYLKALQWPDMSPIYPESWAAIICLCNPYPGYNLCEITQPVPVEQMLWGTIKALYR